MIVWSSFGFQSSVSVDVSVSGSGGGSAQFHKNIPDLTLTITAMQERNLLRSVILKPHYQFRLPPPTLYLN